MGPCTKQNYLLAFQQLDGKVLKAGEEFNFNHYLIKLKGYCKGQGDKKFLFYGGVCGVASQLFRAGLTSPQVQVTQRSGHNDRYSKYYGDVVQGDDAAVYETSKRFKFRNSSSADLIIKSIIKGSQTYLFFITDKKAVSNQRVEIQKDIKSPLEVQISKTIYQDQSSPQLHCQSHLGKIGKL